VKGDPFSDTGPLYRCTEHELDTPGTVTFACLALEHPSLRDN